MNAVRGLAALAVALFSPTAFAQDEPATTAPGAPKPPRERREAEIREIEKGTYLKTNVGSALYLGDFAGAVDPGTSLALGIGHDFIDQETTSMAFEFAFFQGVHNGCPYSQQADPAGCSGNGPGPFIQGDIRTYTFLGALEWATYPTRRLGIGVRAGAGMMMAPLLMDDGYYKDAVVQEWGERMGSTFNPPDYHEGSHILVLGGPNVEYYTKLNHFSIGADVDVFYPTGFDLGMNVTATLKYTF